MITAPARICFRINESAIILRDTVWSILAAGYGNTASTQGGYTGIKIKASLPTDAPAWRKRQIRSWATASLNFASLTVPVSILWDDNQIDGSRFPKIVGTQAAPRGAAFPGIILRGCPPAPAKTSCVLRRDGTLQAVSARGDSVSANDTSVITKVVSSIRDTVDTIPLYRLGPSHGTLIGLSADSLSVFSAHKGTGLVRTEISSDIDQIGYSAKTVAFKEASPRSDDRVRQRVRRGFP